MNVNFHDREFSEGTQLKLDIFRRYIREWIPVFFKESRIPKVNIFDFFSGPGVDKLGNQGTPLIIVDEIKKFCESREIPKSKKQIYMFFNDHDEKKINSLKVRLSEFSKQNLERLNT